MADLFPALADGLFDAQFATVDRTATELTGTVARQRQSWPNADGSRTVLADLTEGHTVRGRVEINETFGPSQALHLMGAWNEHRKHGWQFGFDSFCKDTAPLREAHRELYALMKGQGFWGRAVKGALAHWGERAVAMVRRDPFLLYTHGLPGCWFVRCDRLWQHLGLRPDRLKRQALAAWHAIQQLDGHTWAPLAEAITAIHGRVGAAAQDRRALALLCRRQLVELRLGPRGEIWIADRDKMLAEQQLAHDFRRLQEAAGRWPIVERTKEAFPPDPWAALSDHQIEALRGALVSPVAILCGGPGTGKTFCAAAVVAALRDRVGLSNVRVCAPTGKAAVRITEKMREARLDITATTIHRLVGAHQHDTGEMVYDSARLDVRWLVIDEMSMTDTTLLCALFTVLPTGCHVLLVGDQHQLQPVGHGAPLRDLLTAGLPAAKLREVRRNAGSIVGACHAIREGNVPPIASDLMAWTIGAEHDQHENLIALPLAKEAGRASPGLLCRQLDNLFEWLSLAHRPGKPWDLMNDVQVICARNATRHMLSAHLQQRLNKDGKPGPGSFRVGDKVIQCHKNAMYSRVINGVMAQGEQEYVANGDQGRVVAAVGKMIHVQLYSPRRTIAINLNRQAHEERSPDQADQDERESRANPEWNWELAYAITCHRGQGSEWPVVVVVVEPAGRLGSREWIYTALSRAKDLCLVLGDRQDIARCVQRTTLGERKTFLVELITGVS